MTPNHRPAYHFLPERDWMNDPNGLIQWQGETHLFYQYTPGSALSGVKYWGHAVSTDLVRWQHRPVAIAPTPGGPDAGGIWSGCAVDDNGVPTAIYSGVDPEVVCAATSRDGLLTWEKHPANPIISGPPAELAAGAENDFRDPYVWREDGAWHLVLGCKQKDQGGMILRYRSADLTHWDYVGVLWRGDQHQTEPFPSGTMWECPNYFALDGRRVLIYSAYSSIARVQYPVYYAASVGDQPFTPSTQGILAHGPAFYAPHGRRLNDGRMALWGWLKETRPDAAQVAEGWSGCLTLPLVLTWRDDALRVAPAAEVASLRGRHWPAGSGAIAGDCLELDARLVPGSGLRLRASPDGAEHTDIHYDSQTGQVVVDTAAASLDAAVEHGRYTLPASPDANGQVRLRVFVDRSTLEVFSDDGTCLAARIYPTREDSLGVSVTGQVAVEAWEMASIW